MQAISRFIFERLMGWHIHGSFPSNLHKFVIAVAPHTSYYDFCIGVLVRSILQEEINWIGKKSLFSWPFGWFFKWMGGAPIDRSKKNDTVTSIVKVFEARQVFRLALSPEGTRKMVDKWKTGFYYIAKNADVPIILVAFDYKRKEVKISDPFKVSGHLESDLEEYHRFFDGVEGYRKV